MSLASITNWVPASANKATIASLQTLATNGGYLRLNPNVQYANNVNNVGTASGPYVFNNIARSVSLTSGANLSGINFIVNGFGSEVDASGNPFGPTNQPLSVTLAGPNNNTVDTFSNATDTNSYIFTSVTSVFASTAVATAVSVGFGINGITDYVFMDYDRTNWYASCSAQIIGSTGTLTYTFYGSLNKPSYQNNQGGLAEFSVQIPAYTLTQLSNLATPTVDMAPETASEFSPIPSPIATAWFTVVESAYTATKEAYFTILQQGVR